MKNEELNKILFSLENVARKHTIEVCDDGSMIETMSAQQIDELRLNNYSAKILLNYINKQKEVLDKIKERIKTYPHISYASVEKIDGKRLSGQLIPVTEILELLEEIE